MAMHTATNQRHTGAIPARDSRPTAGIAAPCRVAIRNASYQTRVSAMRFVAGCATERLSGTRDTRSTRTHGVHVAEGARPHRMPGRRQESRTG
jgi:hypothetical protein